ncbi:AMP-binding protein, partial [Streptomyces sp. HC44]|nr:AMP-binding protein [Streptomyces scabichelini]
MSPLFPALTEALAEPDGPGAHRPALRFGDRSLTYGELAATAAPLAERVAGAGRIAVWATPTLETAVAVVAALLAGVPAVPLNPKSGGSELGHIVSDSAPTLVLAGPDDQLPSPLGELGRVDIDVRSTGTPRTPADASPD